MDQTYPLRLLDNAWQLSARGQGQILLFADANGASLGALVDHFHPNPTPRRFHYQLGPDAAFYGYYPLLDVVARLYSERGPSNLDLWFDELGIYPPNRAIWRQLLIDHYLRRPPLLLKDHVIQQSLSLGDDLARLLAALSADRPVLVALTNGHWASPALQRWLGRQRPTLAANLMILVANDADQLPLADTNAQEAPPGHSLSEAGWLIDLPPTNAAIPAWPLLDPVKSESIPTLIQQALQNHALLCHEETLTLCDQINQMLDERQIVLVTDHRYDLLLLEAEALFYSDRYNGAITALNELLELARQEGDALWQFDAYLRLAWCGLHKYRLGDAWQMIKHAQSALQSIDRQNADWLMRERQWLLLQALLHGQEHRRLPEASQHRLEALLPMERNDDFLYAFRLAQVSWAASLNPREQDYLRKALIGSLKWARRLGNKVAVIKVLQSIAQLQTRNGRHERALRCLYLALHLSEPLNSPGHDVPILSDLGWLHLNRQNLTAARDTFQAALQRLQQSTNYHQVAITLNNLAWTYFVGGNLPECDRLLGTAIRLCRSRGFRSLPYHTLDDLLLHQALCRFHQGNSVLAQRTLHEIDHRHHNLSAKGELLHSCLSLYFARAENNTAAVTQLNDRLDAQVKNHVEIPAYLKRIIEHARGLGEANQPWLSLGGIATKTLSSRPVDVVSLLRSAELEGEVEKLQQRVRDTRLLSHLSAQANAATDAKRLVQTLVRQLSAHLDCDYVAIELRPQAYMSSIFYSHGLDDVDAERLHHTLALHKLTRGRVLLNLRDLNLDGFESGALYINSISLPKHDFGDLMLMTRQPQGFEESVLRTSSMLAAQLAAAIQRLMHEKELQYLSSTDMLTGLINRQALYPRLEEELARTRRHSNYRFCLAFLDLDNFKYLNDHYGHNLGDQVLQGFAKLLDDHSRAEDLVARLGGDEFVILFPGQASEQVERFCSRLLVQFSTTKTVQQTLKRFTGQSLKLPSERRLGCSVGIIELNKDTVPSSVDTLLNQADQAMYVAKSQGKNQAVVVPFSEPDTDPE
ncbi:GGDEF domain-containing protein [Saccharospirillum mangrovi]|uniref:GGDEF domain-containing protein n=1 Tax=Saccharospirillum mangrovi TaxID=2161747 RepID=UPI000D35C649|nr:GGDEF domain-containing protein [Saccharospirillum mangrovi]